MVHRYAVYAVPPADHPLWQAATAWLGRDARSDEKAPVEESDLKAEARRYGFHGTLRAPFRLAGGRDEAALLDAVDALGTPSVPVRLRLSDDLGFPALRPDGAHPELAALAEACLRATEPFRAALDAKEYARRRPERLSPRQRELLDAWGYPYVLDEFHFHMTVGARSEDAARHARFMAAAELHFAKSIAAPVPLGLALFMELAPGSDFVCFTR